MIKFELDNSHKGVEILLDCDGVDELINYLCFIKDNNDNMHLIIGNELNEGKSQNGNEVIKHVKLVYLNK